MLTLSEKGHWEKDCPKLAKSKEKQGSTVNITHDTDKDSDIAPTGSAVTDHND